MSPVEDDLLSHLPAVRSNEPLADEGAAPVRSPLRRRSLRRSSPRRRPEERLRLARRSGRTMFSRRLSMYCPPNQLRIVTSFTPGRLRDPLAVRLGDGTFAEGDLVPDDEPVHPPPARAGRRRAPRTSVPRTQMTKKGQDDRRRSSGPTASSSGGGS